MDASTKEQLQQAYGFIKSGRKREARGLLAPIVQKDRENEQAWFLLAYAVNDRDHQIQALRQVLRINPQNMKARSRLDQLETVFPESGAASGRTNQKPFEEQPDLRLRAAMDDPLSRLERLTNPSEPFVTPANHRRFQGGEVSFTPTASAKLSSNKPTPPFSNDAQEDLSADRLIQSFRQPEETQEKPLYDDKPELHKPLYQDEPIYHDKPLFQENPLFKDFPMWDESPKTPEPPRKKRRVNAQDFVFVFACVLLVFLLWLGYQQREQVKAAFASTLAYFGLGRPAQTNGTLLAYPEPLDGSGGAEKPIPTRRPANTVYNAGDSLSFIVQACPFSVPDGMHIECGFIAVPQNRQTGDSHKTSQLFTAVSENHCCSPLEILGNRLLRIS
jgi:hypothetical protein